MLKVHGDVLHFTHKQPFNQLSDDLSLLVSICVHGLQAAQGHMIHLFIDSRFNLLGNNIMLILVLHLEDNASDIVLHMD